jgi:hypothetical protein
VLFLNTNQEGDRHVSETVINVREETQNLINALHALSPSRNYLIQYLLMLPKEYPTVYDLFPEFLSDIETRESLRNAFGLEYASQVNPVFDRLAYHLRNFLGKLFDLMESRETRDALCNLLGVTDEALFNPRLEWIKAKLDGIRSESRDGPTMIKILQILATTEEPFAHWRSIEDLRTRLKKTEGEIMRSLTLSQDLSLIRRETKGNKDGCCLDPELLSHLDVVKQILEI